MRIVPPVRGLRPLRALRTAVLKVPKPTKVTASPFLSDVVMVASVAATIFVASDFETPVSLTMRAINCCLFIGAIGAVHLRAARFRLRAARFGGQVGETRL